jgi:cytochrome c-type biogenesis protein CcmH
VPQILADLGEALALSDPEGLQGEAGAIFERVLAMSPAHPKGLWYGGLNAYENCQLGAGRPAPQPAAHLNPPETLVPLIEERIAARARTWARRRQAVPGRCRPRAACPLPPRQWPSSLRPEPAPRGAPPRPAPAGAAAPARRSGQATDGIRSRSASIPRWRPPARGRRRCSSSPATPGRPAAGRDPHDTRRAADVGALTDANAMMEGVTILDQPELELIARVSLSGSPAQRPGDLFGAVNYARGNSGPTRITIDRVAE